MFRKTRLTRESFNSMRDISKMEEQTQNVEMVNFSAKNVNTIYKSIDQKAYSNGDLLTVENDSPCLGIIGTGNYGIALASQFRQAGLKFLIGSRSTKEINGLSAQPYEEVIEKSDILFLCIPPYAYDSIVPPLASYLRNKTIADVSNIEKIGDKCNALKLKEMLPESFVMKALNTVSAYTLEHEAYGVSRDTFVCGDNDVKKKMLMNSLREIGLNPIDKGRLQSAVMIESLPHRFFPNWGTATFITVLVLIPVWFYSYLRIFWYRSPKNRKKNLNDLGLYEANRIIAWTMFWVLALTYLPGILAGFIQIGRGTKYSRFPRWLDQWMKCRKQLGLICLFLCSIHGCMSCLLLGAGEVKHMLTNTYLKFPNKSPVVLYQLLDWSGQVSLLFATLSLALMGVLSITSLPSVNATMSWKEWDFVQRGLGFLSLVLGFLHVMIYVYKLWDPDYEYGWKVWQLNPKGNMPPGAFIMPMFPLLVIVLKVVLMLPGVSCYLNKIRKGRVGYKASQA